MKNIVLYVFLLTRLIGIAQVQYGGNPLSKEQKDFANLKTYQLGQLDKKLNIESNSDLFEIGVFRNLEVNVLSEVKPVKVRDYLIYKFKIKSDDAESISIYFNKLEISSNTKLFFYNKEETFGAYTIKNVEFKKEKRMNSPLLNGSEILVEVNILANELAQNNIRIEGVGHNFYNTKDILSSNSTSNTDCILDVNCPEGDEWCNQIRSVAYIRFRDKNSSTLHRCSGALINDVNNDVNKQYFLTARHCTKDVEIDWETVTVHFNYQNATCGTNSPSSSNNYTVQGLNELAYCDVSYGDGSLLMINEQIPLQYNVYYSGWDINGQSLYTNLHIIHHPAIKPKKITSGQIQFLAGPKWDIYWDNGIVQGGSSGSSIFKNDNKKIIAVLSGGEDYDCDGVWHDWAGKLKACWGVSSMGDYLAKGQSNIKEWGGIDPILACQENISLNGKFRDAREYNALKHQIHLQADKLVKISNVSRSDFLINSNFRITARERITLLPSNYGTHIENGAIFSAYIAPCSLEGYCGYEENNENYQKRIESSFLVNESNNAYNIYPNPSSEDFNIAFDLVEEKQVLIQVLNAEGFVLYEKELIGIKGSNNHKINLKTEQKILFTKICFGEDCHYAKLLRE